MLSKISPVALIGIAALSTGCSSQWPFGDVCNQEYRVLFALNLSEAEARICDATSDGWDDDQWAGFADYHDQQDDVESNDLFGFIPPEVGSWLLHDQDIGIAACTDRNVYWDVMDWAREQPWIDDVYDEHDLWAEGIEEYQPFWSDQCADFWWLEAEFRCFQLQNGLLPKSIEIWGPEYERCEALQPTGVDWGQYYPDLYTPSDEEDEEEFEEEE